MQVDSALAAATKALLDAVCAGIAEACELRYAELEAEPGHKLSWGEAVERFFWNT